MPSSTTPLWHEALPQPLRRRPALDGDTDVDVAIVGAGYTGLWTAYSLRRADPTVRVLVIEREHAGFGASGRNGGWCSAVLPMGLGALAAAHGRDGARRMTLAMHDTVDEVGRVAVAEGIDCRYAKGGTVVLARNPAHVARLREDIAERRRYGFGEDDHRWLGADEARAVLGATTVMGAAYTPHCAAIQPALLAHGLADAVERSGARIVEGTAVRSIAPHRVITDHGTVRAAVVVRATEAWTSQLPGLRRATAPIYSLMIATEPLPQSFFDSVGWRHRETFSDARRLIIYGQRTADDRIAFGGRGAPYHFASRLRPEFDRHPSVHAALHVTLRDLFPQLREAEITHRWGGPVGVPRDWYCSVGLDRVSGLAWAGGYVGDGVATSNLAGRTLADLITGTASELTTLPWVEHRSRRWEPEPLRWLGINGMVRLPGGVDRFEARAGRPERWRNWLLNRVLR